MGLYDVARQAFTGWINLPSRSHWGVYIDTVALMIDAMVELVEEGTTAAIPGQVDVEGIPNLGGFWSVDALPYIGEDRMVVRGLAESDAAYALRLRRYRDDWRLAGTAFGLLDQVAGVLTTTGDPAPLLRIFTTTGRWYTRHPDGTFRYQTAAGDGFYISPDGTAGWDSTVAVVCDWDSLASPHPPGWNDPTRFFLVIYCPTNIPYLATIAVVLGYWRLVVEGRGTPDAAPIGTCAPIPPVETCHSRLACPISVLRRVGSK